MATTATDTGRSNQKKRTRAAIVEAARELIGTGAEVTMPTVARAALVSEATAYRYFPDLPSLTDAERDDLAVTYIELLRRLDRFFVEPDGTPIPLPYIAGWHQAVVGEGRELGRLHLQVFSVLRAAGKLKYLAGVESGMAAWISDTTPERVASRLQELGR